MIPLFKVQMAHGAETALQSVLYSGQIAQGPQVDQFEKELTKFLESDVGLLTVNSGTSALELALYLIGVGPGDEVITTPMTCTATNGAIVRAGAIPVWADVDPATGLISPAGIKKLITDRTVAIMAVDWAGQPCAYDALRVFGLPIIQDAAHSFGARYKGQSIAKTGGDYVCWSFQAIKHLTTGDGGLLKVPSAHFERAKKLRWFGLDRTKRSIDQSIDEVGFKMHMNDIAATLGLHNLKTQRSTLALHRDNAEFFHSALRGLPKISIPRPDPDAAWWFYPLLVNDREHFEQFAKQRGVFECSQVHKRNDTHPGFTDITGPSSTLDGVEYFSQHQIAIPCGWWLDYAMRNAIVKEIKLWASR